jgi:hypothetical protein
MKQPPYTVAPLVGAKSGTSLRSLLLGHLSGSHYYEAHYQAEGLYLLWMEFSRFGALWAYPCVLDEKDGDPLVFCPGNDEKNTRLLERWNELITAPAFARFSVLPLQKAEFQKIYRSFQDEKKIHP